MKIASLELALVSLIGMSVLSSCASRSLSTREPASLSRAPAAMDERALDEYRWNRSLEALPPEYRYTEIDLPLSLAAMTAHCKESKYAELFGPLHSRREAILSRMNRPFYVMMGSDIGSDGGRQRGNPDDFRDLICNTLAAQRLDASSPEVDGRIPADLAAQIARLPAINDVALALLIRSMGESPVGSLDRVAEVILNRPSTGFFGLQSVMRELFDKAEYLLEPGRLIRLLVRHRTFREHNSYFSPTFLREVSAAKMSPKGIADVFDVLLEEPDRWGRAEILRAAGYQTRSGLPMTKVVARLIDGASPDFENEAVISLLYESDFNDESASLVREHWRRSTRSRVELASKILNVADAEIAKASLLGSSLLIEMADVVLASSDAAIINRTPLFSLLVAHGASADSDSIDPRLSRLCSDSRIELETARRCLLDSGYGSSHPRSQRELIKQVASKLLAKFGGDPEFRRLTWLAVQRTLDPDFIFEVDSNFVRDRRSSSRDLNSVIESQRDFTDAKTIALVERILEHPSFDAEVLKHVGNRFLARFPAPNEWRSVLRTLRASRFASDEDKSRIDRVLTNTRPTLKPSDVKWD